MGGKQKKVKYFVLGRGECSISEEEVDKADNGQK